MNRVKALEKIKSHLDKMSNRSVTITARMARYWWNICNVALFNEKLYPPQITIKPINDWGFCQRHNDDIIICLAEDCSTREVFFSALVHEMVHQWELQTYGRMGHGKRFKIWDEKIEKKLHLDIGTVVDEDYFTNGERLYKRRKIK